MELQESHLPWEQLPGETPLAYSRFTSYLFMGERRSKTEIAKAVKVSRARIQELVEKYDWDVRAEAYDRHLAGKLFSEWEQQARELNRLHLEAGRMAFNRAVKFLDKIEPQTNADIVRMLEAGVKIMRDAGGIPQIITHEVQQRTESREKVFVVRTDPAESAERIKRLEAKLEIKRTN